MAYQPSSGFDQPGLKTGQGPVLHTLRQHQLLDAEIAIDFPKHQVFARGEPVELSPTEFRLLTVLTRNPNQILSQDQLLDQVWGSEYGGSLDVVRLYGGYLRRKIELDNEAPTLVETVRGFGYRYRRPAP